MTETKKESPFTDEFIKKLKTKYTSRFIDINSDQMLGILWAVGEFSVRGGGAFRDHRQPDEKHHRPGAAQIFRRAGFTRIQAVCLRL